MEWEIEYTDEFEDWWNTLNEDEQEAITVSVGLLEKLGPNLLDLIRIQSKDQKFTNMKELRTQYAGEPYRTLLPLIPEEQPFF